MAKNVFFSANQREIFVLRQPQQFLISGGQKQGQQRRHTIDRRQARPLAGGEARYGTQYANGGSVYRPPAPALLIAALLQWPMPRSMSVPSS